MKLTDKQLQLQVHHVGGIEGCGPADVLLSLTNVHWTFYDADKDSLLKTDTIDRSHTLINKCIGNIDGMADFYILKEPSASSLYKPSKKAKDYIMPDGVTKWGDHTKVKEIVKIKVNKLSTLLKNKEINSIDFLSIDAQGSELDILKGTDLTNVMGIACETEYTELYENQPLFSDIVKYLHNKGFKLYTIFNSQYFKVANYPKIMNGNGFITVEELLFLKDPEALFDNLDDNLINLVKLFLFGIAFKQPAFAIKILLDMEERGIVFEETDEPIYSSIKSYINEIKKLIK